MNKLLADYSRNSGKMSSLLFNSLLLGAGQKNLPRLIELLEADNILHKRLKVSWEKLLTTIQ